jgi:hypothetical protein
MVSREFLHRSHSEYIGLGIFYRDLRDADGVATDIECRYGKPIAQQLYSGEVLRDGRSTDSESPLKFGAIKLKRHVSNSFTSVAKCNGLVVHLRNTRRFLPSLIVQNHPNPSSPFAPRFAVKSFQSAFPGECEYAGIPPNAVPCTALDQVQPHWPIRGFCIASCRPVLSHRRIPSEYREW